MAKRSIFDSRRWSKGAKGVLGATVIGIIIAMILVLFVAIRGYGPFKREEEKRVESKMSCARRLAKGTISTGSFLYLGNKLWKRYKRFKERQILLDGKEDVYYPLSPKIRQQVGPTCYAHAGATFIRASMEFHKKTSIPGHEELKQKLEHQNAKRNPRGQLGNLDDELQKIGLRLETLQDMTYQETLKLRNGGVPMYARVDWDYYKGLIPKPIRENIKHDVVVVPNPNWSTSTQWALKNSWGGDKLEEIEENKMKRMLEEGGIKFYRANKDILDTGIKSIKNFIGKANCGRRDWKSILQDSGRENGKEVTECGIKISFFDYRVTRPTVDGRRENADIHCDDIKGKHYDKAMLVVPTKLAKEVLGKFIWNWMENQLVFAEYKGGEWNLSLSFNFRSVSVVKEVDVQELFAKAQNILMVKN